MQSNQPVERNPAYNFMAVGRPTQKRTGGIAGNAIGGAILGGIGGMSSGGPAGGITGAIAGGVIAGMRKHGANQRGEDKNPWISSGLHGSIIGSVGALGAKTAMNMKDGAPLEQAFVGSVVNSQLENMAFGANVIEKASKLMPKKL